MARAASRLSPSEPLGYNTWQLMATGMACNQVGRQARHVRQAASLNGAAAARSAMVITGAHQEAQTHAPVNSPRREMIRQVQTSNSARNHERKRNGQVPSMASAWTRLRPKHPDRRLQPRARFPTCA